MTELLLKYFRSKQQEVQSEKVYDTQCPFCSMQCKMQLIEQSIVKRKKYRVTGKDNPTSQGRICVKGVNAHQHVLHPERVMYPLYKQNGKFNRISWDEAISIINERFRKIQSQYGSNSLSLYGGGSLTNEVSYLMGKFARVALGTKYIDYNGRFCMSAAASAANAAFGIDRGFTNSLSEIPDSKCILLVGTNIAECQPTILRYFEKAKENGSYIIVVDPRETATAKLADLHLKIKPGMDAALANGLLKVLIEGNYMDKKFITNRTMGYDEVQSNVSSYDFEEIESLTGISLSEIRKAAVMFGESETGMIFTARGVEQQTDGYMAVRNFLNILLLTGKIGKYACGYGAITGQGNGQGGREHGLKADQLPGYRSIENREHRQHIADVWGVPEKELPRKGVSAYEMMEKITHGEIKGMLLMGSNPIVSNPNADFVKKSLAQLDFLVTVDMFISESAAMSDLILPASSYLENEGTMTNLEGRVVFREANRQTPGEVKHDWEILCEIAKALNKEEYFSFSSPEDIFNELRIASKGGVADYYGITYERLKQERGILWPCPDVNDAGTKRLFDETFYHQDEKAVMIPVSNQPKVPKDINNQQYPLTLTTGRVMSHYLTGVQTRRSPSLSARNFESFIEIHPRTAEEYNIRDGMLVEVQSKRGKIVVRSKLTEMIRQDTVFVPFHWSETQNVNVLISDELDPVCRMPGFKVCAVNIRPLD
ncbi:assimilatory nitrate reductase catalytic subunit NasC [Bacillus dakarensis]|uniref:assimilatory nitrate reductase catalytic subunit NasC n=1 Tax=Robertmurraya dakarensis TaxID=1926278 RepID=UPI0009825B97|nr:molybdopterin oxidoreductase family protein [Bacillus dakarensis]